MRSVSFAIKHYTPAGPLPAVTFDASAWSDHGGIVLLVQDRLYLRRLSPIDRAATAALDRLRTVMLRSGGGMAIAEEPARRRDGDLPRPIRSTSRGRPCGCPDRRSSG